MTIVKYKNYSGSIHVQPYGKRPNDNVPVFPKVKRIDAKMDDMYELDVGDTLVVRASASRVHPCPDCHN